MTYTSKNFELRVCQEEDHVFLTQQVHGPEINTKHLPRTVSVLSSHIPTIFQNQCFNTRNWPFKKEVESTEVGHLFEHLVLENLKILAMKELGKANFKGETSWNWAVDKFGKFHIKINSPVKNENNLKHALEEAVRILEMIYLES